MRAAASEQPDREGMTQAQRVGIYGGTFDPIHIGHLAIAEEVRVELGLSQVIFVPAARQPLKGIAQGAPPADRLAMAHLACADNAAFRVDDLELERPPPSYTVDTLEALRERCGSGTELWFILGADAARELPRWREVERVADLARLVIVGRPGYSLHLPWLEAALPSLRGRVRLIDGPMLDISSTELRRRLAAGRPVRYQLPEPVRIFIQQRGLYSDADT
jgi:nicotinate (nicotinamide) nucleotide adenylyltransferase